MYSQLSPFIVMNYYISYATQHPWLIHKTCSNTNAQFFRIQLSDLRFLTELAEGLPR
jgi:hypothetical protein